MNAVIMIAVLSVGISSVYGTSRTLVALADANQAPKIFNYIDKMGRPLFGILLIMVFGLLSFLVASSDQVVVFNWMLAISGLSSLFTWLSICLSHIRFRRAMNVQGRNSDEIIFSAQTGIWGSIYGATLIILVLIAQFWVALFPIGGTPNASDFFQSYLSFPVVLFFYLGHKIWTNNWILFIRAKDIDIDTGRRDLDLEVLKQELAHEKEIMAGRNIFIRWWNFWC